MTTLADMREALFAAALSDAVAFLLSRAYYEQVSFHPRRQVSNRVAQSLDPDGPNCYHTSMKIVSGKVIEGRIVVEGGPLDPMGEAGRARRWPVVNS
ncbi:MAG TPA: hypothetical protein PLU87_01095 [Sedimentisphaerales bacterium]|nr:hypothetical protein [Sedimentisphaerales bacterium]HRS09513.1 hypothetical protein [Sedimentisphaerales bacterium]HRV46210.1 hypothetical protein [Sedimentisphaerales bacterium]